MKRTYSLAAQAAFDLNIAAHELAAAESSAVRLSVRLLRKFLVPVLRTVGAEHVVSAEIYGRSLQMPTQHSSAPIVAAFPQHNRPLGLAAQAIARIATDDSLLLTIDVGANIGETIAVIEQACPNRYSYLCIEPDEDLAELCRRHRDNLRVEVLQQFAGEVEGAGAYLEDDGRANPSTNTSHASDTHTTAKMVRLDTLAIPFAQSKGGVSLIKIDTEGYDFSIMRSGQRLLENYQPALYFEWFPKLLSAQHESTWGGFDFLQEMGYKYFVFYSAKGDYYTKLVSPDPVLLRGLASLGESDSSFGYFDVFASIDEQTCNTLVTLSIAASMRAQRSPDKKLVI